MVLKVTATMNILASLLNLGGPDLIVILLLALLLFGAKKLPELARGMGLAMKEFHKAKDEFDREISKPISEVAIQPAAHTLAQNNESTVAAPIPSAPASTPVVTQVAAPVVPATPPTNLPS